jgi:hypothetical protein
MKLRNCSIKPTNGFETTISNYHRWQRPSGLRRDALIVACRGRPDQRLFGSAGVQDLSWDPGLGAAVGAVAIQPSASDVFTMIGRWGVLEAASCNRPALHWMSFSVQAGY